MIAILQNMKASNYEFLFWSLIQKQIAKACLNMRLKEKGLTILLTSHFMDEVEEANENL